jgi:hypothetical protein
MNTIRAPYTKPLALFRLGILLMAGSMACSMFNGGLPSKSTPVSSPGEVSVERNVAYGSGPFVLPDARIGIADLTGYKATLTISFDGTRAGASEKWTKTYTMLASQEPAARQLTVETNGEAGTPALVLRAEMEGMAYTKVGEDACSSAPIQQGNTLSDQLEPAGFLNFIVGADEAGSETVNGLATKHYTFDQHALGQQGITESTGEVWVASEGGFVVKYILTSKGKADYFGEGLAGTLSWDYELTDPNRPVTIRLPKDCPPDLVDTPPGPVDAPMLPDAANVDNLDGVLSYDTSTSLKETAAFYQEKLADLGWQPAADPAVQDTVAYLTYTQEKKSMSIVITSDDKGTHVHVMAGEVTEAISP